MKKRFSEEQIIKILEEAKTGITIQELCRKHNIARAQRIMLGKQNMGV